MLEKTAMLSVLIVLVSFLCHTSKVAALSEFDDGMELFQRENSIFDENEMINPNWWPVPSFDNFFHPSYESRLYDRLVDHFFTRIFDDFAQTRRCRESKRTFPHDKRNKHKGAIHSEIRNADSQHFPKDDRRRPKYSEPAAHRQRDNAQLAQRDSSTERSLRIPLPGFRASQIMISLPDPNQLQIVARHRDESNYQLIRRRFNLPKVLRGKELTATYDGFAVTIRPRAKTLNKTHLKEKLRGSETAAETGNVKDTSGDLSDVNEATVKDEYDT